MLKYSDIIVQPLKYHRFKILKAFSFLNIAIPVGFITDGASVPRLFWCLFPPNKTDYLPCAIIHDYLCRKKEFRKADSYFHDCLYSLDVDWFSRKIMYWAVRLYHLIRYGR